MGCSGCACDRGGGAAAVPASRASPWAGSRARPRDSGAARTRQPAGWVPCLTDPIAARPGAQSLPLGTRDPWAHSSTNRTQRLCAALCGFVRFCVAGRSHGCGVLVGCRGWSLFLQHRPCLHGVRLLRGSTAGRRVLQSDRLLLRYCV
jgi:hypothetical protein